MDIENIFTYHAPTENQLKRLQIIRTRAKELAHVIESCTLPSADQSAAIRHLRECVMTANAAVVLGDDIL